MHEVSYQAEDFGEQDIKGYPKLRYPRWDFSKSQGHRPMEDPKTAAEPGKYDVSYDCVKAAPKTGIPMERALPRSVSDTTLGHFASEAVLHPDKKRAPGGCVLDRSAAKDCVKPRVRSIDFDNQLQPPAPKEVPESVVRFEQRYDASEADRYTSHRRDIAHSFSRTATHSRRVAGGLQALKDNRGFCRAMGMGSTPPKERMERIKADSTGSRIHHTPLFENYTSYQQTTRQNNFVHGSALVKGTGPKFTLKQSSLARGLPKGSFERKAEPGFVLHASLGGARVPWQSRSHQALPIQASDLPPD